ncbi:MAG: hypothetical protein ACRDXX_19860 [Stackebrandtia sp.]
MPKQLNPLPPSAKRARRVIWAEALVAVVIGALIVGAHYGFKSFVPQLVADNVYRAAAGLAAAALTLTLLTVLMRYQWRWVWWLTLLSQIGIVLGLLWVLLQDFPWYVTLPCMILPIAAMPPLSNKVTRRWFNK